MDARLLEHFGPLGDVFANDLRKLVGLVADGIERLSIELRANVRGLSMQAG